MIITLGNIVLIFIIWFIPSLLGALFHYGLESTNKKSFVTSFFKSGLMTFSLIIFIIIVSILLIYLTGLEIWKIIVLAT